MGPWSSRKNISINIRTKWNNESNRLEAYTKSSTEMFNICGRIFLKIYQFLRNKAILPNIKEIVGVGKTSIFWDSL